HDCDVGACAAMSKKPRGIDPGVNGTIGDSDDLRIMEVMAKVAEANILPLFLYSQTVPRQPVDDLKANEVMTLWSCWTALADGIMLEARFAMTPPGGPEAARKLLEDATLRCKDLH